MIKSDLIHLIASRNPHLYAADVDTIVNAVLEDITQTLENGGRVELRGFGTFSIRHRPPKAGRNPRNGQSVEVDEKWVPIFRARKHLNGRLNFDGEV